MCVGKNGFNKITITANVLQLCEGRIMKLKT